MKAFLLAAGLGTRLRPLTETLPKCLVPIDGKPLLDYWFDLFRLHGITEVLINLHHLPQQVRDHVETSNLPFKVRFFDEPELLGSAGTVYANREWVRDESEFLILYADNLTEVDLSALAETHRANNALLTMGLFETPRPRECGIVSLGPAGEVLRFEEKPEEPESNLANAGVYVADPGIFRFFPDRTPSDLGFDVLPALMGRMHGHRIRGVHVDVGTMERYAAAQEAAERLGAHV